MELGPILRSMRVNRVKVGLLVLEIAVTTTIVLNCVNMIGASLDRMATPTGIDEAHIIAVRADPWSQTPDDENAVRQIIQRDLTTMRALPGVVDAGAVSPFPLEGGGSSFEVRPLGGPPETQVRSPLYNVDDHAVDTLGLDVVAGRAFTPEDVPTREEPQAISILVTQELADALFPDGDALGKAVATGNDDYPGTIVGVVRRMHTPYGGGPMEGRITLFPIAPTTTRMQYLVRTEPAAFDSVFAGVEEALLTVNPERVLNVQTLLEIKGGGRMQDRFIATALVGVMGLLLLVTVMGISGMVSSSVTQRTKQIGTRRALGATRMDVVRYFLVEISAITAMGMTLGTIGAYALNIVLVNAVEGTPLPIGFVLAGVVALWLVALAATALPARRAAAVAPATATRTV